MICINWNFLKVDRWRMQDWSNFIANALELLQSCSKPLICTIMLQYILLFVHNFYLIGLPVFLKLTTVPYLMGFDSHFPTLMHWQTVCGLGRILVLDKGNGVVIGLETHHNYFWKIIIIWLIKGSELTHWLLDEITTELSSHGSGWK